MERSGGLAPYCRDKIHEEIQRSLQVNVPPSCSRRLQRFRNASTMKQIPQTAVAVEWSLPEPKRQASHPVDGRDGEMDPFGT